MATVIRLSRRGRRNRPHYRVGVFDRRTRRDGPPIEDLGHYDPYVPDAGAQVVLNAERLTYWLQRGADVSDTVKSFLRQKGIALPVRSRGARTRSGRRKTASRKAKS